MLRRELLTTLLALAATLRLAPLRAAGPATGEPFDYAWLKGQARALAGADYRPPGDSLPPALAALDYTRYQAIQYQADHSLWRGDPCGIELQFFHPGFLFNHPVQLYEVADGLARVIDYDPARFDFGASGIDGSALPESLGYAGFRIISDVNPTIDVAAFLGASYFRAVGADKQYGLSARGLAIGTGMERPEEFPRFTAFWFERPRRRADRVVVYAMLDSPSCAGAYRFDIAPGALLVMEIDAAIYPRRKIERIGLAPLTSMYQTGENDRRLANDFRPEIHDSDGLAMWTGAGEWIWRPLENPRGVRFNMYADENPRGFGLLQRDRDFDHYQDDGVFYDRRPGVWVEPKGAWGPGAVTLVELPAPNETFDNIAAFWNPARKPLPGDELLVAYRLYWGGQPPVSPSLATVVATRTGLGGVVGDKRTYFSWRFAVDFVGGVLPLLAAEAPVELALSVSRGTVALPSARPLLPIKGYRAIFDLRPDDSTAPINLRLQLVLDSEPLSETWIYQYSPPPLAERRF